MRDWELGFMGIYRGDLWVESTVERKKRESSILSVRKFHQLFFLIIEKKYYLQINNAKKLTK